MGFEVIKPMKMVDGQVVPVDQESVNPIERSIAQSSGLTRQMESDGNHVMYTGLGGMKDFRLAMQGYINALEERDCNR